MYTQDVVVLVNESTCVNFYDYSISDKVDVIMMELDGYDYDRRYVEAVNRHVDLYIDTDEEAVEYFLENGIAALRL